MARVIAVIDLARAIAAAGAVPVRDGANVVSVELAIAAHLAAPPTPATIWAMRLRYPDPPRLGWLARWRRRRRQRAGVAVTRLTLRWSPSRLDALIDGEMLAGFALTPTGELCP